MDAGPHNNPLDVLAKLTASSNWVAADAVALNILSAETVDASLVLGASKLLLIHGELEAGEAYLAEACSRWPENEWLPFQFAQFATTHRDFDTASTRWKNLRLVHPMSPLGLCGLANLHRHAGAEGEASLLFEEALSRYPDDVWAADGNAVTATLKHDWRDAALRWRTVRDQFPEHFRAHHELVNALIEDDCLEEAAEAHRTGLVQFPGTEGFRTLERKLSASLENLDLYITSVFQHLLLRAPEEQELREWSERISSGLSDRSFYFKILSSQDYGKQPRVIPGHPPGHYYSPIVDPTDVGEYWQRSASTEISGLRGISIDIEMMELFWQKSRNFLKSMRFSEDKGGATRYYYNNEMYHNGDALILAAMIDHYKPKRVIEIGSGMSSAAILDAAERSGLADFSLTCIEPDATRLRSLLRAQDHARVRIIEGMVQHVPMEVFGDLQAGDILFIDSSHVVKTGSDVHHEIFNILPALSAGVIIHIHDIQFPFEYPKNWIFDARWSWNESYFVRAFLMHNDCYKIVFFTDMFLKSRPELTVDIVDGDHWPVYPFIGYSIWLEKLSNTN